jgi:hypothetical protein
VSRSGDVFRRRRRSWLLPAGLYEFRSSAEGNRAAGWILFTLDVEKRRDGEYDEGAARVRVGPGASRSSASGPTRLALALPVPLA